MQWVLPVGVHFSPCVDGSSVSGLAVLVPLWLEHAGDMPGGLQTKQCAAALLQALQLRHHPALAGEREDRHGYSAVEEAWLLNVLTAMLCVCVHLDPSRRQGPGDGITSHRQDRVQQSPATIGCALARVSAALLMAACPTAPNAKNKCFFCLQVWWCRAGWCHLAV